MTLITSSKFASASAAGTDWRDTSKIVLEQLEKAITKEGQFNLGFLYISDFLADDAVSILNLFKSVTGIQNWIGCTGLGICAGGHDYLDEVAISAMIGSFGDDDFQLFPAYEDDGSKIKNALKTWQDNHDPMLVLVHGDPMADMDPGKSLNAVQEITGGFVIGGLSSSRSQHIQFSEEVVEGSYSGAVFSSDVSVSTGLSQGCQPIGPLHTVTKCDDHVIFEIDGKSPFEVFQSDIRNMVIQKTGKDPDTIFVEEDQNAKDGLDIPEEFQDLFKGAIHVAFAVSGSDQKDYMVRNIIGVDPDEGVIAVSHRVSTGDHILFAHRDEETIESELSSMLVNLRNRITKERGEFKPMAGLYVSCAGRVYSKFQNNEVEQKSTEMELIKEIIGDIPITGFYASGEISNNRLYGYTGILTLFF
ncbi:MAG: FIST N-terminal domain-containing protein [Pseudomonadota bacterium]